MLSLSPSELCRAAVKPIHVELTTGPTQEPVTVEDMRLWAAVENESQITNNLLRDDELVREFVIPGVRVAIEGWLSSALITQSRTAYYDAYTLVNDRLELSYKPLQSITSVKYTTTANDGLNDYSDDNYYALTGKRSELALEQGATWPSDLRSYDSLQVEYVCGYGVAAIGTPDYKDTGANGEANNILATGGQFCGSAATTYRVTIQTDTTFKVTNNSGVNYFMSSETITGEYQELQMGVYIKFPATSGYTPGDYWDIACTGNGIPQRIQIAMLQLTKYVLAADAGFVNDRLNQAIEGVGLPPAIKSLLGKKVRL